MTSRKGEGVFGMLGGGGEWLWRVLCGGRGGVSLGNGMAPVCWDALGASCGSSVLCGASSDDKMGPGPLAGCSMVGGVIFTFKF